MTEPLEEQKEEDGEAAVSKSDGMTLYPETWEQLKELLSEGDYAKFHTYIEGLKDGSVSKDTWLVFDEEFTVKERRGNVHSFFKESVKLYETDTICKGESRKIQLFLKSSLSNTARKKMKMGDRKPKDLTQPQYLKIAVHKTNMDSMQAVHYIAKRVRKVARQFQIAGNKDKRGTTTQWMTIQRANAEQLIRQQRCKDWDPKIKVGSFERVFKPLSLGALKGNRFSIALRFIPHEITTAQIKANVSFVKEHGFINYFGMQRFGSYNIRSHEIGRECLMQNWRRVIEMILGQHAEIDQKAVERKKNLLKLVFQDFDIEEALQSLDRRDRLEKAVLLKLKRGPTDYYNAFNNIARNTRLIYVHGYQSYVWNRAVSKRMSRFGRKVLVGDLVIKREDADLLEERPLEEGGAEDEPEAEADAAAQEEEKKDNKPARRDANPVLDVTEENIGEFTIEDVVMPMIGSDIRLPSNSDIA